MALQLSPVNRIFFRKRVRKVIISEEKWRVCDETSKSAGKWKMESAVQCSAMKWSEVKWCEVKWGEENWSAVMILSEIYYNWCIVKLLYLCSVQYVVSLLFAYLLFSNYSTHVLWYSFYVCFLLCIFLFYFLYFVFVYFCVLFLLLCCIFPIFG